MNDGTDKDNAYLNRLLQRAQEMSSSAEAYDLTQNIARRAEQLSRHEDTTDVVATTETRAKASPTSRRGLRM